MGGESSQSQLRASQQPTHQHVRYPLPRALPAHGVLGYEQVITSHVTYSLTRSLTPSSWHAPTTGTLGYSLTRSQHHCDTAHTTHTAHTAHTAVPLAHHVDVVTEGTAPPLAMPTRALASLGAHLHIGQHHAQAHTTLPFTHLPLTRALDE